MKYLDDNGEFNCSDSLSFHIAMIGPVPDIWGGKHTGGVATHLYGLSLALAKRGIHVRIMADNADGTINRAQSVSDKIQLHHMIRPSKQRLLTWMTRVGLDRVIRVTWRFLTQPALRNNVPIIYLAKFVVQSSNFDRFLSLTKFDILHIHHAEFRLFLCRRVLQDPHPTVVTVHSATVLIRRHPSWLIPIIITNYHLADRIIAVSNFVKDMMLKYGADSSKISVISNGVNTDIFKPGATLMARSSLGLPRHRFTVLFTGSLTHHKGVDILMQAFSKIAEKLNAHLIFVGTGPEYNYLKQLAAEMNISARITFAGHVPFTDMPLWYQASDVFVLPSRSEGLSVSILEAMASGKPVITTSPDIGEHDAVLHGRTGLLIKYGDVDQLIWALEQVGNNCALREKMGRTARNLVKQKFDWNIIADKTIQIYQEILENR